jgi:hypothetical protein
MLRASLSILVLALLCACGGGGGSHPSALTLEVFEDGRAR